MARMSSGFDDEVDLQTGMLNSVGTATIPRFAGRLDTPMVVGMSVMLLRPASRGRVFIRDTDPESLPAIELALGSANEDISRHSRPT
jgi:choline dehydrogenase